MTGGDHNALRWQLSPFAEFTPAELYACLQLRQRVFVVEQNCPYLDLDDLDQCAFHLLCWRGDTLLATQRCLPPGLAYPQSALGRVVVAPEARGLQLGRAGAAGHRLQPGPVAGQRHPDRRPGPSAGFLRQRGLYQRR
ncbi:MAG: GNAT family N-acetyltransferase [Parahaliea sp.]